MHDADAPPKGRTDLPAAEDRRAAWRERRRRMEAGKEKHTPRGIKEHRHWNGLKLSLGAFGVLLRLVGLYERGVRNACEVALNRLEIDLRGLPAGFDGYRILQISDPHVDFLPQTWDRALALVADEPIDLCVLTGDYRKRVSGPFAQILPAFEALTARRPARDGILAILGNHDCADMVAPLEAMGIDVLINESRTLRRGADAIHLTGTDDVHYYYTEAARAALESAPDGFNLALVHSAELADVAAGAGFDFYLCGHSHAGQVCLPGGRPIITHMALHRELAAGLWRHGAMTGYTSAGLGVSGLPVRFYTRGEAALLTLRRR